MASEGDHGSEKDRADKLLDRCRADTLLVGPLQVMGTSGLNLYRNRWGQTPAISAVVGWLTTGERVA